MGPADLQRRRTVSARPHRLPFLSSSSTTTAPSPPTRPPPSRPSSTSFYSSLINNGPHQGQYSRFSRAVECILLIVIVVVVQQTARKSTGGECRHRAGNNHSIMTHALFQVRPLASSWPLRPLGKPLPLLYVVSCPSSVVASADVGCGHPPLSLPSRPLCLAVVTCLLHFPGCHWRCQEAPPFPARNGRPP